MLGIDLNSIVPEFIGNVTTDNADEFTYRVTSTSLISMIMNFNVLYFSSLEFSLSSFSLNGIFGSFYTANNLGFPTPPTSYLAEYDMASSWGGALNPVTADMSQAMSFVATEYVALTAYTVDREVIDVVYLGDLQWSTASSSVVDEGDLSYVTFVGTQSSSDLIVSIDVVTSNVLGRLNWGAVVTPRMLKTRVNITNFQDYGRNESVIDTLELNMVVASATMDEQRSVSVEGSDVITMVRATDNSAENHGIYFEFSKEVSCDGNTMEAKINITAAGTSDLGNESNLYSQLTAQVSAGHYAEVLNVSVSMPAAGVNEWLWDPSLASGTPPATSGTGGNISKSSAILAVSITLCLVAAAAFAVFQRRKRNQDKLAISSAHIKQNKYQGVESTDDQDTYDNV